ncbi:MAG TPA: ABC transporter ATP-binding protein [bacterium]|nr:ABC transporter ATP-binding protein [bacterium]
MWVTLTNIRKVYPLRRGEIQALGGVSLSIRDGEFMGLVGPNGCGKTTLLHIIAGLEAPSQGRIDFQGARSQPPNISMVWQDFALMPWRTVETNVGFPLEIRKMAKTAYQKVTDYCLQLLNLRHFEKFYPEQLSGGMKQRTGIARALAHDPELILMDEPFANLDAQVKMLMQQELLQLWERDRKTILYVTHHLEEAVLLCDRIAIMSRRPGHIRRVVDVDLPRPRTLKTMGNPGFSAVLQEVWNLLVEDVQQSMEETRTPEAIQKEQKKEKQKCGGWPWSF